MKLYSGQVELIANSRFIEKLDAAFRRDVPGFSDMDDEGRYGFLFGCLHSAREKHLLTEQGVASYALAVWWLGAVFEEKSRYLQSLLASGFPEVRKVYAMNAWVSAVIGAPEDIASADEKLRQGFYLTSAWGGAA